MLFSPKTLSALTLAALLAGPALAQQTTPTTKTKTKTKHSAANAAAPAAPAAPAGPDGTPPPPPGEGPRGPHGKGGPHGPGGPRGEGGPRADHALQAVQNLSGPVVRYVANPEGLYDGFVTTLSGTETTVHFPLHMAKAVMAAAKAGQTVSFSAVAGHGGRGPQSAAATPAAARLELVSLQNGSTPLLMQHPERPRDPDAAPTVTTWSGKVSELRRDDRGQVRGLVLADNTLLLLPPHVGAQLGDKLKVGETVQATGAALTLRDGMVAATDVRRVHAQTLTVGGVQYLVH